jgi:hypothetical protein
MARMYRVLARPILTPVLSRRIGVQSQVVGTNGEAPTEVGVSLVWGRFHMIKTETISDNVLRITAPAKLKADDFRQIAPQVDSMISPIQENQIAD